MKPFKATIAVTLVVQGEVDLEIKEDDTGRLMGVPTLIDGISVSPQTIMVMDEPLPDHLKVKMRTEVMKEILRAAAESWKGETHPVVNADNKDKSGVVN